MNNLFQVDENIVKPESGVTILFNTVNSLGQCGQQKLLYQLNGSYCMALLPVCNNQTKNILNEKYMNI